VEISWIAQFAQERQDVNQHDVLGPEAAKRATATCTCHQGWTGIRPHHGPHARVQVWGQTALVCGGGRKVSTLSSSRTKMFKLGRSVKGFALYRPFPRSFPTSGSDKQYMTNSTPKLRLLVEEHVIRYSSSTCKPSRYHRSPNSQCFLFFLGLVWSSSRTKMFKLGRM